MDLLKQAVVETAMAYYNKGVYIQYDSEPLTYQDRMKSGPSRLCSGTAPELASADWPLYTVCSDFCYNVYKVCFGYELMGSPRNCPTFNMTALPADHPLVVVKGGREDGIQDKNKALEAIKNALEVGDILVMYARNRKDAKDYGHAMLFLGDCLGDGKQYLCHSIGHKINMETGIDWVEPEGSIVLTEYLSYCFDPDGSTPHTAYLPHYNEFIVLRPFRDPAFNKELDPCAKSRVQYPGLSVDRFFDRHRYVGARPGEAVTVTVSVKNTSKVPYQNLTVTETLPQGAVTKDGSAPQWTVDVLPGCEVRLQYTVTVTAKDGETAVFPAGKVAEIPTRAMELSIREDRRQSRNACSFANGVCRALYGTELGFPENPADMITGLFDVVDVPDTKKTDGKLLSPKNQEDMTPLFRTLWKKLLPEHVGGRAVYLGHDPHTMGSFGRVKLLVEEAYLPGDVFYCLESPSILKLGNIRRARVYIYLGHGLVLTWDADKSAPAVLRFDESIGTAMRMNVILGFRP